MRAPLIILSLVISGPVSAATPAEILANNTRAIVYLEVDDATGQFIDSGTGFIVSHDGYVVTAAHIKVEAGQRLWGVIGQREGTRFTLERRELDEPSDVALWQLPQSAACRYAVTLTGSPVHPLDRVLAIGFPGREGLSPAMININNVIGDLYKADGFLRNGYSGGPVFNEDGKVVATVRGGTPAGGNNDLVPIAAAINLIKKKGVRAGIESSEPFEPSCFAFCRAREHGVERWEKEIPWSDKSGELPGGHTRRGECDKLIAAALTGNPGSEIDLLPGEDDPSKGMWEESHKDFAGQMHYTYFCRGTLRIGPIFKTKQSPACGLWQ